MLTVKVKDEWVRAAMTDDNVVVELLVRLKQAQAASPSPKSAVAPLKWGVRQPRSRPMSMRCDAASAKRDGDFNAGSRGSPTTPLSWSGGGGGAASPSVTDDFEETSKHVLRSPPTAPSRSKGTAANETTSTSTTTKRSRRKKTFAELKEEENMLLKERIYLKKEIASMRANCKQERAMNENLKRIKLGLNLQTAKNSSLNADDERNKVSCRQLRPSSRDYISSTLPSCAMDDREPALVDKAGEDSLFLLPDLNMIPTEDDLGTVAKPLTR